MEDARSIAEALGQGRQVKNGDGSWNTVCPAHDDNGPSLTVTNAGKIILVKCHAGCTQEAVIEALISRGLWKAKTRTWSPIIPCPDNAPRPQNVEHSKFGKPATGWAYKRRDGKLVGYIYRFNSGEFKQVLPLTYCQADDGERAWQWKSFTKPRPLFGEHLLDVHPDKTVLIVEGEKTAEAATEKFGEYLIVTWPGGSKAVRFVNWEVLKGRKVVIWPDADEPGQKAAADIAEILAPLGIEARIVALPPGLPKGWDLADDKPEGMTFDERTIIANSEVFEPSGDSVIDEYNRQFALVLLGDKAVVMHEEVNPTTGIKEVRNMSLAAFNQFYGNRFVSLGRREVAAPTYWMGHHARRSYKGVVFEPGRETPGFYNLWQGFSVEPDPTGDWSLLEEHIRNNVARGDESLALWVLAWFAQIMQQPGKKAGTSLGLRGKMGTGKTILGQHMGALIRNHYKLVDDVRYVTGQFNSHMASALILHSDEAFWAGDPRHVGRLRGIVTSKTHFIEQKGKDSFEVNNYMRLFVSTNNDWVVPAGYEERRFAVLDMGDDHIQDKPYFQAMERQLEAGGYGGLLHYLLNMDLTTIDVGVIPKTAALKSQKELSFDTVAKFLYERLSDGETLPNKPGQWLKFVSCEDFYQAYVDRCQQWGQYRREASNSFGREIKKLIPGVERARRAVKSVDNDGFIVDGRPWCYDMPPLDVSRQMFSEVLGEKFDWQQDNPLPASEESSVNEREEIPF